MSYTAKLRIEVPAALYDTACAIARALDPDVGGSASYGPRIEDATSYATETPCTPEFAAQAIAMLGNPEMLHAVVSADYASRWADLAPPTLAECGVFCAGVVVSDPHGHADGAAGTVTDHAMAVAAGNPEVAAALGDLAGWFVADANGAPVPPKQPAQAWL